MKLILVILTAVLACTTAKNATLYTTREHIEDQYIVVVKDGYDMVAIKNVILVDRSGIFDGATIKHTYTNAINGFSAKISKKGVEKLLAREEIEYIAQDGRVHTSSVASWGLDRIAQRRLPLDGSAHMNGDGSGVNVYVIDTGIYPNSLYFEGRATVAYDAINWGSAYGIDCNGHGTHCAGTIGAAVYGVAPGVNLFGVRVLNCYGGGSNADVIAGIDYVAKSAKKPAVASMSLGGWANQAMDDAVRGMINSGVTTAVAAGNSNRNACQYSPARVPEAITVGATAINDRRAYFSNYGTCVDVFAPGVSIPSVWINGLETTNTISGTSMACPHVAGAVAISLGNTPRMAPPDLKNKVLEDTTKDVVAFPGPGSPNRLLYVP